jgi:hypothetical protein
MEQCTNSLKSPKRTPMINKINIVLEIIEGSSNGDYLFIIIKLQKHFGYLK